MQRALIYAKWYRTLDKRLSKPNDIEITPGVPKLGRGIVSLFVPKNFENRDDISPHILIIH